MFCYKCGNEVDEDAVVCIHCGCQLKQMESTNSEHNQSKSGIGVVMALFLGIIGLIIGICIYPSGTVARLTFVKAWIITFCISLTIVIFFYGIIMGSPVIIFM